MGFYTRVVRPFALRGDAERMHDLAVRAAERASASRMLCDALAAKCVRAHPRLESSVAGIDFPNPIGLAAGYDKSGRATPFWAALGFGHVEIGSVSAWPSKGNPKPRLWRIPEDHGLVVNYGLPNDGAERVAARLADAHVSVPLGVNIVNTNHGADSAASSDDEIIEDYVRSVRLLNAHAGYLMLNLSCPNTADGRAFVCDSHRVRQLLNAVREAAPSKPVFLKVAPFSNSRSLDSFLEQVDAVPFVRGFGINLPPGKVVPLRTAADRLRSMPGAVSGLPCRIIMDHALTELYSRMDRKRYCLIGTGGVSDGASAYRKIRLGASLVQVLNALVYEGPGIVQGVLRELDGLLARDGFSHVADAVGIDNAV